MAKKDQSIVGDLINFRGLVYAPLNENGVIFLFGKIAADLNMYVEEIKPGFPDCIARRFTGKGWERVTVEFEFASMNFKTHGHEAGDCDLIVCWEHDWPECPLEVIELKSETKGLPNQPIQRPDSEPTEESADESKQKLFRALRIPPAIQDLYEQLEPQLLGIDDGIWRKVASKDLALYSPKRVFVYVKPQKSQIRLTLFTRGERTDGVEPIGYEKGGAKYGRIYVKTETHLPGAVSACKVAWERVQAALAANEPTGWYAEVEESDVEPQDGDAPEAEELRSDRT